VGKRARPLMHSAVIQNPLGHDGLQLWLGCGSAWIAVILNQVFGISFVKYFCCFNWAVICRCIILPVFRGCIRRPHRSTVCDCNVGTLSFDNSNLPVVAVVSTMASTGWLRTCILCPNPILARRNLYFMMVSLYSIHGFELWLWELFRLTIRTDHSYPIFSTMASTGWLRKCLYYAPIPFSPGAISILWW
jgi:hypothetical protein